MFNPSDIAQLAQIHFGISAHASPLPGEIDLNFLLTASDGQRYTLKIANPNEPVANLEMQNAALIHLAAQNWDLEIPRLIPNLESENIAFIKDREGQTRYLRLLTWIPGRPLAKVNPHTPELLYNVGVMLGKLTQAFSSFQHPAAHRFLKWDPSQALWTKAEIFRISDPVRQELAAYFAELFEREAAPLLPQLRQSVTYGDANDYNILVSEDPFKPHVPGVIDFGDMVFSHTVNELAIALTYAMMDKPDPLQAVIPMVEGFHPEFPLTETEIQALFPLLCARLLISVTCSAINLEEEPGNVYLQISDRPAWDLLRRLREIPPRLAWYAFRGACGLEPCPHKPRFAEWAEKNAIGLDQLAPHDLGAGDVTWLDLSVGSLDLGNHQNVLDAEKLHQRILEIMAEKNAAVALGNYDEIRPLYTSDGFTTTGNQGPQWRSVHIGLDVFMPAGTPVFAPLPGKIHSFANNLGDRDYGPTIILEHAVSPELTFYTLYGHLDEASIQDLEVGQPIKKGALLCRMGPMPINGNWSPHLHFQIILDMLGGKGDFPGVAFPHQRALWTSISPDPWLLLTGKPSPVNEPTSSQDLLDHRKKILPSNLSVSYRKPLQMVRGYGAYLYDVAGRRYLDTVNNVAHVGHEHPRVVRAGQRQMAVLNTNTRYLHPNIVAFSEALLATFPPPLEVVFLVNSGSEANELALRLAKTYTGQKDMLVVEVGYHGNTNACVEVSSYKFDGPGGKGAPPHTHVLPIPDAYRGLYRYSDPEAGPKFASHIQPVLNQLREEGKGPAAFLCESVISCGGQVVLPPGYLPAAYLMIRESGGVCIADEVQTGFGRAGAHFWAFEAQGVVPDIVTMGKPIGNGHPLAAVVTTRAIADAFHNGMEYFNTFGGNPVSCAIGLEVLHVIQDEHLQQNAQETGAYLTEGLKALQGQHPIIGDVRGPGLFLGFELVLDPISLEPATIQASYLANRMRELGVLMSTDGPYNNVLKIKPPMVFGKKEADFVLQMLERVLGEDGMN
ncbi:MAG: aminotransferase class III-fold pyridoxal phosphate-dependent enzyme [Haliscomenobacter sp.]|nr:aminotransferase class III-fold pyridoxal phosphate-dependent enzyme [Haliscomenobacter sp.]